MTKVQNSENPLFNLLFNIVLPVVVLHQLSKRLGESGPLIALVVALLFPIGYGFYEYRRSHKHNLISVIGFVNVLFTGGFAFFTLEGHWFAVKEAFFPFLIGIAVLVSVYLQKPFLKTMFWNENVFQTRKIEDLIAQRGQHTGLAELFSQATILFAMSFFLSSFLNYWLASTIFLPLDGLDLVEKSQTLNEQIAQMTWKGYVVIALPMMIVMMLILTFLIRRLKLLTGLKLGDLLHMEPHSNRPKT